MTTLIEEYLAKQERLSNINDEIDDLEEEKYKIEERLEALDKEPDIIAYEAAEAEAYLLRQKYGKYKSSMFIADYWFTDGVTV